jgi:hypothetical protein
VEAIIIQLNKDGYLHYGISESNKEAQNNIWNGENSLKERTASAVGRPKWTLLQ